nr:MAG TPA: hypothetical protein [Caudoviricetes sp.]
MSATIRDMHNRFEIGGRTFEAVRSSGWLWKGCACGQFSINYASVI